MQLFRYVDALGNRSWAVSNENDILPLKDFDFDAWLAGTVGRVDEAIHGLAALTASSEPTTLPSQLLAPIVSQEVWAAGVTYERSREARQEEAQDGGDIYARVYRAERPEIFFKAPTRYVVGHGGGVGIRQDATWNVPEPELGVVLNPALETVGFIVGNDMSSRDIEGENPLYLPQAKIYNSACALGPGILISSSTAYPQAKIQLEIIRNDESLFKGEAHTSRIRRSLVELMGYLSRSSTFPVGLVFLTGTGIIPPGEFTLLEGDIVSITIEGIGTLTNPVKMV